MNVRTLYVLPALVMLAGCAGMNDGYQASNPPAPTAAAPQRVNAVSDALGARVDNMLASQPAGTNGMTR